MNWTLVIGLTLTAITLVIAGQRVMFLVRLITGGQPAPDRIQGALGAGGGSTACAPAVARAWAQPVTDTGPEVNPWNRATPVEPDPPDVPE